MLLSDFSSRLARLGLSQTELLRWIEAVTGHRIAATTPWRWATGRARISPEMDALLSVIERPALLDEIRKTHGN